MKQCQSFRKRASCAKKKKCPLRILLILLLVGGLVFFAYKQGVFDGIINSIIGGQTEEPPQLPEVTGKNGNGSGSVGSSIDVVDETLIDNNGKFASVLVPNAAVAEGTENVSVTIYETNKPESVTVEEGLSAVSYYVAVTGLAEDNTAAIKVQIYVGEDYDTKNLAAVYCDDKPVEVAVVLDGYVVFETASLGICTIVIDPEVEQAPVAPDINVPVAIVTTKPEYANVDLEWNNLGGYYPNMELGSQLEAVFQFASPHDSESVLDCEFKDWECDFWVKLDRALAADQILLGGNYGDFGWVGFHNGDVTLEAGEEIPLLGSVTQNAWTYEAIVGFVGNFLCGVADVNDSLAGATFTVTLRLTNPEDSNEFYDVNVVAYTFGDANNEGTTVITNYGE